MKKETFIHPSGQRESEVDIEDVRELGSGGYGWVREVVVSKGDHKRTMALKRFFKHANQAQEALDNYNLAKNAALKVFTTYRINKERNAILMTNGNNNETACLALGWKEDRLNELGGEYIQEIENFDELLESLYREAEKATKNGLYFNGDEFFFLVDKEEKTKVDFVLGDLDGISKDPERGDGVMHNNLKEVQSVIRIFLDQYLAPEISKDYIQRARNFFSNKKQNK